ncbi:hypothetical protein DPMN_010611 [Dreissena polymorpha]|uniref:Uncharacterized protein n=1 Tax=Dreissena polymorpha TaxID=45954 RepID=A0A9D4N2G8_DREPO|nr:hypothetical protein DPMN_010611 [Dreissena polymorpha]
MCRHYHTRRGAGGSDEFHELWTNLSKDGTSTADVRIIIDLATLKSPSHCTAARPGNFTRI